MKYQFRLIMDRFKILFYESCEVCNMIPTFKCLLTVPSKYFHHLTTSHETCQTSFLVVSGGPDEKQFKLTSIELRLSSRQVCLVILHAKKILVDDLKINIWIFVAFSSHYFLHGLEYLPMCLHQFMHGFYGIFIYLPS